MIARLLDLTPEQYHQHPGFSASTAKTLISRSELHAWHEHPAFGGNGKVPTKVMDRGSAIHTLLLGKGARLACLPYDSWRTDASKESRERTRAAGLVPLLHEDYTAYELAASRIRQRLEYAGHFISNIHGRSECAIEWEEPSSVGPVLCRCMMDHVVLDEGLIYEVKVVEDAHPDRCERSAESMGYAIAAAAYIRALLAWRPNLSGHVEFRFLFCEAEEPHAVYDPQPTTAFLSAGEEKWLAAVERWGVAKASGHWPHYQNNRPIHRPRWAMTREERQINEW